MKRLGMCAAGLIVALISIPSDSCIASIIHVGDYLRMYDGPGSGNGGEFKVRSNPTDLGSNANWLASPVDFHTFCVEINETMSFGTTYRVGGIGLKTVATGRSLKRGVAWLYEQFWQQNNRGLLSTGTTTIGGQSYALSGSSREDDARSLQLAVWRLMGEVNSSYSGQSGSTAVKAKATALVNAAVAQFTSYIGGAYADVAASETSVRVMNLRRYASDGDQTDSNGNRYFNVQDQLVMIPEPGSIAVWGLLALCGLGIRSNRRRS
jgi:Thioester domain